MSIKRYDMEKEYSLDINVIPVEESDGAFVKHEDYAALEQQLAESQSKLERMAAENAALKAICEDRRQFILNGVEMGFIRLPDKDIKDPAKATYERCLSGMQAAPCQKCNDTGMTDSGGTQPWGEPIEIECDCGAYQLRQGGAA